MATMTVSTPEAGGKPTFWRRRWVQLTGVGIAGLVIGSAGASSSTNTHSGELKTANAKVASLSGELSTTKSTLAATQQRLSAAQSASTNAVQAATAQVRAQDAATRHQLAARKAALDARQSKLAALQAKVSGQVAAYNANSIPGDGEFLVGRQVKPGIYQAAASPGCYWARLSSLNTQDIIDNNNVDGPTTVQILASDTAFQTQGCATFHKIG